MPKKPCINETNEPGSVINDVQKKIDRHKKAIVELKELIAEKELILNKIIEEKSRDLGITLFKRQLATQEKKLEKLIVEKGDLDE